MATISGNVPTLVGSGQGNDVFNLSTANTTVQGVGAGEGVSFQNATSAEDVNLQTQVATGWSTVQLSDIEGVFASPFGGTITAAADTLYIALGTGSSTVHAGSGSETIFVGQYPGQTAGAANIDGGSGLSVVDYANLTGPVTVDLAQGVASHNGVQDQMTNVNNVVGNGGGDVLMGNNADNYILGGTGNDHIDGRGGNDTLTGGGGSDTFVMDSNVGHDAITDFNVASDIIDISAFASQFTNFAAVMAASTQVNGETTIHLSGSGSVTLDNVSKGSLTAADFGFTPAPLTTVTGSSANNFTATFGGVSQQYAVGAGGATVMGGPENANDSLVNMHRIQFVDGYEAYSTSDTAAEVYRLYEATLNRAPDQGGLTGWTNALNSGTSLQSVANGFVSSAEFQTDYGALDNAHFINLLYENVLHRESDPTGQTYWLGQMSGGMTQAQVVLGFTQSPEDINDLAAPVQQGLWVGNPNAAEVARLYDTTLGRLPDAAGLAYWTNQLQTGTSLQTVVNGFVGSSEFQTDYGPLDNTHFVSLLYNNVLHRAPDPAGQSYWLGQMSGGMSRAQVVLGFSDSAEHVADLAPHIDGGIWLA